jgi:hypothetical protein
MVKPKLIMESAVRIHAINERSAAISVRVVARFVRSSAKSLGDLFSWVVTLTSCLITPIKQFARQLLVQARAGREPSFVDCCQVQ